jgi:2-hydroxychromene-2-carboxylate isomerase
MGTIDWYFDFVSPFAYFQLDRLREIPPDYRVVFHPVLLAGLLDYWGTKGPAEVPAKRTFTYRYVEWFARRQRLAFRFPPAHPFNPLVYLRLAVALECDPQKVRALFEFIWGDGRLIESDDDKADLAKRLGVVDIDELVARPAVKEALRKETALAAERGVFGVPTAICDGELFWGEDATDMLLDYLRDPGCLQSAEMQRISRLPVGAVRG